MATRIGWDLVTEPLVIKAGSSGALEMACVVMQADGSPLPSYDSWTCRIVFVSPFNGRDALVLVPTVAGDAMTHTLTATLTFTPEDTSELPAGT